MIELVGGPRDGERVPTPFFFPDSYFVAANRRLDYVRAESAIELLTEPMRAHVYQREYIDGHPTLSFAYRGLR